MSVSADVVSEVATGVVVVSTAADALTLVNWATASETAACWTGVALAKVVSVAAVDVTSELATAVVVSSVATALSTVVSLASADDAAVATDEAALAVDSSVVAELATTTGVTDAPAAGTTSTWPIDNIAKSNVGLAAVKAATVTPLAAAILESVSPSTTV